MHIRTMQIYNDPTATADSNEALRRMLSDDTQMDALERLLTTPDGDPFGTLDGAEAAQWRAVDRITTRMRSALRRVLMAAEVIADGEAGRLDPERTQAAAGAILSGTRTMAGLVDDIVDASRVRTRRLELHLAPVDLLPLVRDAVWAMTDVAADAGVLLDGPVDATLPRVLGDAPQIRKVLRALLDNAVRHTPSGGHTWVETSTQDDVVCVAVWDSGPGVDMADLPRLLQPFERGPDASVHGAGLGLSIAEGLLELHGGRLEVASWEGIGSRFTAVFRAALEGQRRR